MVRKIHLNIITNNIMLKPVKEFNMLQDVFITWIMYIALNAVRDGVRGRRDVGNALSYKLKAICFLRYKQTLPLHAVVQELYNCKF